MPKYFTTSPDNPTSKVLRIQHKETGVGPYLSDNQTVQDIMRGSNLPSPQTSMGWDESDIESLEDPSVPKKFGFLNEEQMINSIGQDRLDKLKEHGFEPVWVDADHVWHGDNKQVFFSSPKQTEKRKKELEGIKQRTKFKEYTPEEIAAMNEAAKSESFEKSLKAIKEVLEKAFVKDVTQTTPYKNLAEQYGEDHANKVFNVKPKTQEPQPTQEDNSDLISQIKAGKIGSKRQGAYGDETLIHVHPSGYQIWQSDDDNYTISHPVRDTHSHAWHDRDADNGIDDRGHLSHQLYQQDHEENDFSDDDWDNYYTGHESWKKKKLGHIEEGDPHEHGKAHELLEVEDWLLDHSHKNKGKAVKDKKARIENQLKQLKALKTKWKPDIWSKDFDANIEKLEEELESLGKSMSNKGLGGVGSIKAGAVLPSINNMVPKVGNNSATPSVSLPQPSKKNPIKQAQQTQNKDIKDIKMKEAQAKLAMQKQEVVKFDDNGQWKIEKGDFAGRDHSKGGQDEANMARRKEGNIEQTGIHAMPHVKEWGAKGPGELNRVVKEQQKKSAKNEVEYTHVHPETGEKVTVSMTPRKLKNYQKKMKALADAKKVKKSAREEMLEELKKAKLDIDALKRKWDLESKQRIANIEAQQRALEEQDRIDAQSKSSPYMDAEKSGKHDFNGEHVGSYEHNGRTYHVRANMNGTDDDPYYLLTHYTDEGHPAFDYHMFEEENSGEIIPEGSTMSKHPLMNDDYDKYLEFHSDRVKRGDTDYERMNNEMNKYWVKHHSGRPDMDPDDINDGHTGYEDYNNHVQKAYKIWKDHTTKNNIDDGVVRPVARPVTKSDLEKVHDPNLKNPARGGSSKAWDHKLSDGEQVRTRKFKSGEKQHTNTNKKSKRMIESSGSTMGDAVRRDNKNIKEYEKKKMKKSAREEMIEVLEKAKVIRKKPNESKGKAKSERDAEAKRDKEMAAQKELEEKLKDPEYRKKALMHQAKEQQEAKDKDKAYDDAVETIDPDARPPVAQKKRGANFIQQFNRRKEAPDKKLINKEKKGEFKVEKSEQELFDQLFEAREKLEYLKKSAREQILEDLEKAKVEDIHDPQRRLGDEDRERQHNKKLTLQTEVDKLKEKSAKQPVSTYKPGKRGFPKKERQTKETHDKKLEDTKGKKGIKIKAVSPENKDLNEQTKKSEDMIKFESNGQWSLSKRCWEGYEPTPGKKAYEEGSCRPAKKSDIEVAPEGSKNRESYQKEFEKKEDKPFHGYNKDKHSKEGGMSAKAREKHNRETGSNLQKPVTSKEAKGSEKKANRRKSFCARMGGVKGPTSKEGKLTRKGAALKRWDC